MRRIVVEGRRTRSAHDAPPPLPVAEDSTGRVRFGSRKTTPALWHVLCVSAGARGTTPRTKTMQAIAKLYALPLLLRRACLSLRLPAPRRDATLWEATDLPDLHAGNGPYRVTDRRLRWTRVRHFADGESAVRHAAATEGVVWERYFGPTGAANWWSLNEAECAARAAAGWAVPQGCAEPGRTAGEASTAA